MLISTSFNTLMMLSLSLPPLNVLKLGSTPFQNFIKLLESLLRSLSRNGWLARDSNDNRTVRRNVPLELGNS